MGSGPDRSRPQPSDVYLDHVAARRADAERVARLARGCRALSTLVEALEDRDVTFFTGHVVVTLDAATPRGPVSMLLDEDDFDDLKWLAEQAAKL